jgi:hypothetical protein
VGRIAEKVKLGDIGSEALNSADPTLVDHSTFFLDSMIMHLSFRLALSDTSCVTRDPVVGPARADMPSMQPPCSIQHRIATAC